MIGLYISLGVLLFLFALFLLFSYYAYRKTFFASDKKKLRDPYKGIDKRGYKPYEATMRSLIDNIISLPYERVEIISRDGLRLSARYYHVRDGAPLEIQCHGYRSTPLRDFAVSGVECYKRCYNLLLIDHRAHGESEGNTITFGIKERFDVLDWIDYAIERFGSDLKIILYGISMGAATVLMASGKQLPDNVVCVLADCGYDSAKAIIMKVISEMELPAKLLYPFVKLGARVYGGFDLEETSPVEAVKNCKVPLIMFHGDTDAFVPYEMSEKVYAACPHKNKRLVKIAGAGHGLAFPVDKELYINSMRETIIEWNL